MLVIFSFMSFIYHAVVDAISVVFLLLMKKFISLILTFAMLYISLMLFFVVFFSYLIFLTFYSRNNLSIGALYCCGGSFFLIIVLLKLF